MKIAVSLCFIALGSCVAVTLMGCGQPAHTVSTTSSKPSTPPSAAALSIPSLGVYVEDDNGPGILVYPASATGPTNPSLSIGDRAHPARTVSLDAAGNIYVLSSDSNTAAIVEYAPVLPIGAPLRSLPVGTGTKIPSVRGLYVSATGEIFVADGTGLSVFSATATGNADPVRRVTGTYLTNSPPGAIYPITVDNNDNAYVVNGSDTRIVIYGPEADGNAVPIRKLGGNLTQLDGSYIGGITTDTSGNLYVVCLCNDGFGVHEFGPTADGNVAPIRVIAGPLTGMYPYFFSLGVAVDSAGNIYVSAGYTHASPDYTLPAVFKFSPTASGNTAPDSVVTLSGWYDSEEPQIAVH